MNINKNVGNTLIYSTGGREDEQVCFPVLSAEGPFGILWSSSLPIFPPSKHTCKQANTSGS